MLRMFSKLGGKLFLSKPRKKPEQLSDEVANLLRKIVIALLIAVAVSQLALQIPEVRIWITGVDRLEGIPF
ncbi:hypothetical protein [Paenibacillus humicola]|uniref:hypothetical protein n=1 Tax=Paenibacillus humicola TaxID=3110540 RepID=UPI00237A7D5E|nr:hypothetical protein [Paenibacillus humicola]